MRIVVIGMASTAQRLSAKYGVPFFQVAADMELEHLERMCGAPNWIAVSQATPEQPALLERADAVMICMEAQAARAMHRLLRQPYPVPDVTPEQVAALKQACANVVMTYGERAALRYPEEAGLSESVSFV